MSDDDALMKEVGRVKWFKLNLAGLKKFAEVYKLWIEITESEIQISNQGTQDGRKPSDDGIDTLVLTEPIRKDNAPDIESESATRRIIDKMHRGTTATFSFRDFESDPSKQEHKYFTVNSRNWLKETPHRHRKGKEGDGDMPKDDDSEEDGNQWEWTLKLGR